MNLKRLAAVPALALALAGGSALAQTTQTGLINVNVQNNEILNNVLNNNTVTVDVDVKNVLNNNQIVVTVLGATRVSR